MLVIQALFSSFDPHNRVETNMYFVFAHAGINIKIFVFFSLLTYVTDSTNFCNASFSRMADHNYNIVTGT